MIGNFHVVFNFNWLFLKLNRFICNQLPVLPIIVVIVNVILFVNTSNFLNAENIYIMPFTVPHWDT